MASHNLLLNEQKTEVVVIAAPNRSRVHSNVTVAVSIDVCGVSVMPKPSIRDIGVVIDDTIYFVLTKHNIITEKQYGFRKKYATYMALIDLIDKISCNFDEKNILWVFF